MEVAIDELARLARLIEDMTTLAKAGGPGFLRLGNVPIDRFLADVAGKAAPLVGDRVHVVASAAGAVGASTCACPTWTASPCWPGCASAATRRR